MEWRDQNLEEPAETELKNRPENLNLQLQYSSDGGNTWIEFWGKSTYAVSPDGTAQNTWSYTWDALPAVDEDGNDIIFRAVQLDQLSRYSTREETPVVTTSEGKKSTTQTIYNSYNDNWNYAIDLYWNRDDASEKYYINTVTTSTATLKASYKLVINTQKSYEIGDLEVRLPYELFDARTGTRGTVFSSIGIGEKNNPAPAYNFAYYIDNKGTDDTTDDELVIYNYKKLEGSNNIEIPVHYIITPFDVVDVSVGTIQAKATGQYTLESGEKGAVEEQESNEIRYRLDTGVRMQSFSKSMSTGTDGRIYYWNTSWGQEPDDFDLEKYNYVTYILRSNYVYANQPYRLRYTDTPEDGGEVYRVYRDYHSSSWYSREFEKNADGSYSWEVTGNSGIGTSYINYYVVVRYPRKEPTVTDGEAEEIVYHNHAAVEMIATDNPEYNPEDPTNPDNPDYNDVVKFEDSTQMTWKEYRYVYNGGLNSVDKYMGYFSNAGITRLEYGMDLANTVTAYMQNYGYNLTEGYQCELSDDAMYARTYDGQKYGDYVRLTQDDYEFTGKPTITVQGYRINRKNGVQIKGQDQAHTYTVYGRKGNAGIWERIEQFSLDAEKYSLSYTMQTDITDQGYTALRVCSDEGLMDYSDVSLYAAFKIKASSELIQGWISEYGESLEKIEVRNFASFKMFAPDEDGKYQWINPQTREIYEAQNVKLDQIDKDELGQYQLRDYNDRQISAVQTGSGILKYARLADEGVSSKKITAQYYLYEYESFNYDGLPQEIYEKKTQERGIYYDLLPLGFYYDGSKSVITGGAGTSVNTWSSPERMTISNMKDAGLVSVRTIDNYRNTGRQMVIFTLESLVEPGKNWNNMNGSYCTGFYLSFYATADYDDLTPRMTQYNIAAFQRDDEDKDNREIFKSYDERGYGGTSDPGIFVNAPDGNRVLSDPDNDGDNRENSTLYVYREHSVDFTQAIETGVKKLVKANSGIYQKDDLVNIDSSYSYKLSYTSSSGGTSRNVILYDILENAENTGGFTGETGWHGTFTGTNVQQAINQGIQVKVWYSTKSRLNYNDWSDQAMAGDGQYLPEDDPDTWTDIMPADPSKVTAVAFDFRTTTEDKEKVFIAQESVSVEILMKAPAELPGVEYAYNRPSYNTVFKGKGSVIEEKHYNISERTTLKLRALQDIRFTKMYPDEDAPDADNNATSKPLGGVTFSLYRCTNTEEGHVHNGLPGNSDSCWGTTVLGTSKSRSDGTVEFTELDTGAYAVRETGSKVGFINVHGLYWIYDVDASKGTVSAPQEKSIYTTGTQAVPMIELTDGSYALLNQRYKKSISVSKTWQDPGVQSRPKSIRFTLYRNEIEYRTAEIQASGTGFANSGTIYTFSNLPVYDAYGQYYTYRVEEEVPDGYYTGLTNDSFTVSNTTSNSTVSFANRRYGELAVTKRVAGETTDRAFDMALTLKLDGEVYAPEGGVKARRFASVDTEDYTEETIAVDADGKAAFTLKHGEKLLFVNLPAVTYSLEETDTGAYTVNYANATGTVKLGTESGTNAVITVTNTVKPVTLTLPVKKILNGSELIPTGETEEFVFTISGQEGQTVPLPAATVITIEGAGEKSFAPITFTEAGTYRYLVKERKDSEKGYTYDETVHTVTVIVTSDHGALQAEWKDDQESDTADDAGDDQKITFINTYEPIPVDLVIPVRKFITGNDRPVDGEKEFSFVLKADTGTPDAPMPAGTTGTEAKATVIGADDTEFRAIHFTKTGTYKYTVSEIDSGEKGYTYAATEYSVEVVVTNHGGQLEAVWTANGQTISKLAFTNEYEPTPVKLTIPVKKTIVGHDRLEEFHDVFTFHLTPVTEGAPMPTGTKNNNAEITITDEGTASFAEITFEQAGTYYYALTEQNDGATGYTYAAAKEVCVQVTDDNGTLHAAWTVDGKTVTEAEFINQYNPEEVDLTFSVEKFITGEDRPADHKETFIFTLKPDTETPNAPMPEGTTDGSTSIEIQASIDIEDIGVKDFRKIVYTKTGTYKYTLQEQSGTADGYSYDTEVRHIVVKISDNDGVLKEEWTIDGVPGSETDEIIFTNEYHPQAAKLVIPVEKKLTGNKTTSDETFTFRLTAEDASENAPMPAGSKGGSTDITIDGTGNENFGEIEFTKAGTYHYTVEEVKGSAGGYTYDTTVHNLIVTVTDNKGILEISYTENHETGKLRTGDDGTCTAETILFTNHYEPTPVSIHLPVEKKITGHPVPENGDKIFLFALTADESNPNAPMPKSSVEGSDWLLLIGEGTGTFDRITYKEAGMYVYHIAEAGGDDTGYTYDDMVYTVTVTVTDQGGVLQADYRMVPSKTADTDGDDTASTDESAGEKASEDDLESETPDVQEMKTAIFTNRYQPIPVTAELSVTKIITGNERPANEETDGEKNFRFTLKPAASNADAPMPENTEEGSAEIIIHGEGTGTFDRIEFDHVGTYHYEIEEKDTSETGYVYDTHRRTVTITVTDDDGQLRAAVVRKNGDELLSEITIINSYEPIPVSFRIPVEKLITGNPVPNGGEKEFTFILQPDASTPNAPMPEKTDEEIDEVTEDESTEESSEETEETVTVTGASNGEFESIWYRAAGTYVYTVKELSGQETGYTYDPTEHKVTVQVIDNDGRLELTWLVDNESAETVKFSNHYDPIDVKVTLPAVRKVIEGKNTPEDKEFEFILTPAANEEANASIPMPEEPAETGDPDAADDGDEASESIRATVTVTGEGTAQFGEITYTEAGVYTYRLQETAGEDTGYGYDEKIVTIVVTVTDVDGELQAVVQTDGEDQAEEVIFTNQYDPNKAFLSIPVSKTIEGAVRPQESWFTFVLKAIDDAPMPAEGTEQVRILGEGENSFGIIAYDTAGVYHYTVVEADTEEAGYTYDETLYQIAVTVTDTDGQLQAEWAIRDEADMDTNSDAGSGVEADTTAAGEIRFVNVYQPAAVTVQIPVTKKLEGDPRTEEETFEFVLEPQAGAPEPQQSVITVKGEGKALFGGITYDTIGEYHYTLKEKAGNAKGYTYDETVYSLTVNVTDLGGELAAEIQQNGKPLSEEEIVFVNTYHAEEKDDESDDDKEKTDDGKKDSSSDDGKDDSKSGDKGDGKKPNNTSGRNSLRANSVRAWTERVRTGDATAIAQMVAMLIGSAAILILLLWLFKRRKKEDKK